MKDRSGLWGRFGRLPIVGQWAVVALSWLVSLALMDATQALMNSGHWARVVVGLAALAAGVVALSQTLAALAHTSQRIGPRLGP
jgi:hypothetical protein